MRRVPLALAAAVVMVTLVAASCGDQTDGIEVAEVGQADVVEVVDVSAVVAASAATTLTAVADGTLAALRVAPGDEVEAGEVLAVVDSPAAEERLARAEEALRAAERAGTPAPVGTDALAGDQRAVDRAAADAFDEARDAAGAVVDPQLREALLAQVTAAEEQYRAAAQAAREAVAAVQQGVASLSSAVAALGTAQLLQAQQAHDLAAAVVDGLTLRAPFDGVVQLGGAAAGTGLADPLAELAGAAGAGELGDLAPGPAGTVPGVDPVPLVGAVVRLGTPVLTVVDVSELRLVADVDETDVLLVAPGETTAEAELDALPEARYPASVSSVDLLPTPSARGGVSYRVRLTLGEGTLPDGSPAPPPRPGMSAVAQLRVREATAAVAVPAAAVLRADGVDRVWRVDGGRAVATPVTLGVQGTDLVQVTAGLRVGDRVVVRGADLVTEGQRL